MDFFPVTVIMDTEQLLHAQEPLASQYRYRFGVKVPWYPISLPDLNQVT